MSKEALKLALDDLMTEYCMERTSFAKRVDEIFKQALEQSVQEPVGEVIGTNEYAGFGQIKHVKTIQWRGEPAPIGTKLYTTTTAAQPAPVQEGSVSKGEYNRLRDEYNDLVNRSEQDAKVAKQWRKHVKYCQFQGVDLDYQITTPPAAPVQPVAMRMPKVGDRVVCIDDESLGTVVYLTAGGSPEIKFDDGSHGTYMLREFAELFGYTTLPAAAVNPTKDVEISNMGKPFTVKAYVTPLAAQPAPVQEPVCHICKGTGEIDHGGTYPWGEAINIPCECTTPPAQEFVCSTGLCHYKPAAHRPWVGLTDEERTKIRREHYARTLPLMEAVEAKLREKNT
jgi:hypothetical protein